MEAKSTNKAVDDKHKRYNDIATDLGIPIVAVAFETYGGLHNGKLLIYSTGC